MLPVKYRSHVVEQSIRFELGSALVLAPWIVGKIWICYDKRNQCSQTICWLSVLSSNCCDDYCQSCATRNFHLSHPWSILRCNTDIEEPGKTISVGLVSHGSFHGPIHIRRARARMTTGNLLNLLKTARGMCSRTGFERFSISLAVLHECSLTERYHGWGSKAFMYYRLSSDQNRGKEDHMVGRRWPKVGVLGCREWV